jgi:putative transposase
MKTNTTAPDYKGYRSHLKSLAMRSGSLSVFRSVSAPVEELLAQRGIIVTYETVRQWCLKFGQTYANEVRRRRPRCGDIWHMDEVILTIRGKNRFFGEPWIKMAMCLTYASQNRRNTKAATRFFRKLRVRLCYVPQVIITDKLKSYGAAKRDILPGVEHRQHKRLNNRAENSVVLQEIAKRKTGRDGISQSFLHCHCKQFCNECHLISHFSFFHALYLSFP